MSRGSGRCMRAVLAELEKAPDGKRNRAELEDVLCEEAGYDRSNLLRALRTLARYGSVIFRDERHKTTSFVRLPPKIEPVPEDLVAELLAEIGGRK